MNDPLTLASAAAEPECVTQIVSLSDGERVLFRPLRPEDVERLTDFLSSLGLVTRHFWTLAAYDRTAAQEICDSINQYDKFRMVAVPDSTPDSPILAMFEFAFWIGNERERLNAQGWEISQEDTCRFGPCIRDGCQDRGLGSALMPPTLEIARRFGKRFVVLWGGVLAENHRAIHFYQKHGFEFAGGFQDQEGLECLDMIVRL